MVAMAMNRAQRRNFVKNQRKKGISKNDATRFAKIISNGVGTYSEPNEIAEDDKVMINIDSVKARKNFDLMSEKYKEFVNSSEGKIFTAHVERENSISLKEEPRWLFWSGDLLKVEGENNGID